VKTKTLRARDAERWCGGRVAGVSQSDVVYIGFARAFTDVMPAQHRIRYGVRGIINFVLCFTVHKDNCTGVYSSAVCQYFCIYTVSQKNWATFLRPITLEILNRSLPNWA